MHLILKYGGVNELATEKLNLPTITGTMTADVVRDLNALAQRIDDLAGVPNGFALLDEDGTFDGVDTSSLVSKTELAEHKAETMPHDDNLNYTASEADGRGIYCIVTYTRMNGTKYMVSTLTNADANGNYQTCIWQFYNATGTTVTSTKTWTLTYDEQRHVTSVVSV